MALSVTNDLRLYLFILLQIRYPHIVEDVIEEEEQTVNGVVIPIDTSQPNPNQTEFDNLYLVGSKAYLHACTSEELDCLSSLHSLQHCLLYSGHEWHYSSMLSSGGQSESHQALAYGCATSLVRFLSMLHALCSLHQPLRLRFSSQSLITLIACLLWCALGSCCIWPLVGVLWVLVSILMPHQPLCCHCNALQLFCRWRSTSCQDESAAIKAISCCTRC